MCCVKRLNLPTWDSCALCFKKRAGRETVSRVFLWFHCLSITHFCNNGSKRQPLNMAMKLWTMDYLNGLKCTGNLRRGIHWRYKPLQNWDLLVWGFVTQIHVRVKFSNNKYCYDSKHILNILETFEYIAHESTTFFMPFYFRK